MSLTSETQARLRVQQEALVLALVSGGKPPAGFNAERLRATADSLARKRLQSVKRAWFRLAETLGPRFDELFASYATSNLLPSDGGPLADGRAFARWLTKRQELPDAGRLQALAVDLRYAASSTGLIQRRQTAWGIVWLPHSCRLVVAGRAPWFGERWLSIPLWWR